MSSIQTEIELLERVLFRLGSADTDEKLETTVCKFLPPVLLKIISPNENVRCKVIEVLTHINKRLKSRSEVQIPVEAILDQYLSYDSSFLHNFAIIYITMGFPRLEMEKRRDLVPKVLKCIEGKPESHQDKLLLLLLPILGEFKGSDNLEERKKLFTLENVNTREKFISILQDVLLLTYGVTQDAELPPGFSRYSFQRIVVLNLKAEELENLKKGIVNFVCSGILTDLETYILLVIASSDTRFSVATPAIAELSKVCTTLDFTNPKVTAPLYELFSGTTNQNAERKRTPCSARVRQKLLQYLTKSRGKGIDAVKGIQIIFEGLFGENTNQKCKVLVLQFSENLIKDGPKQLIEHVSKVILSGLSKLIGKDSTEPIDVQNAAYSALAQLARTCPNTVNQDLKLIVSYFNYLTMASPDLHTSIREALIAMAPAFAIKSEINKKSETEENQDIEMQNVSEDDNVKKDKDNRKILLSSQQNLLLAMLSDNAESKLLIIQNVTSVFLTTCFPEYFPPARYLLLLIAGERSQLHESVTSYLYGVSKKDNINYNMLVSIDHLNENSTDNDSSNNNKLASEQRRVILPSFKDMMNYICEMADKRMQNSSQKYVIGKKTLPFHLNAYTEILDYLRICLWYSAGIRSMPGDEKYTAKFQKYILSNYKNDDNNEIYKYMKIISTVVEAKRDEVGLNCLYDLLNAAPELLTKNQMHLLEPLATSLKDVSETLRTLVAQIYGILLAYGLDNNDFNRNIKEILSSLPQKSLENRHGWILVIAHAFNRKFTSFGETKKSMMELQKWEEFIESLKTIVFLLGEQQPLLISAGIKGLSLIGKSTELPDFKIEYSKIRKIDEEMKLEDFKTSVKQFIFEIVFSLLKSSSVRLKIRENSANCLGYLAIGDGKFFVEKNLKNFLNLIKIQKDAALNIAIGQAIVCTINGYDINVTTELSLKDHRVNEYCNDEIFEEFLMSLIKCISDPNPQSRQSCAVWLLALVKHCSYRSAIYSKKTTLQYAFTELLSEDSEFVQDAASRGLGLIYSLSDSSSQSDLANSLLDQLTGGKRKVNQVNEDTELFAEGVLGKTPTGGNITTYKELCSLASDLNQPEMIYQFMQLANHNASWNSKLGAAFGLKSISKEAKNHMKPYLGKIIPRLYRYKYDPTPKIQNSMISIWDSIVSDSKEIIELYYWDIMKEILINLTVNEWRIRISCCLAVRDLIKRPNGLRLRSEEKALKGNSSSMSMEVDESDVPEPELKELWSQLFRVMDDIHEGTRLAAEGTANTLRKICVVAASSDHGKSGMAVASSILPLLLDVGVTHTVPEIRKISIKTISELIESSGTLITPHLSSLIPCLLRATGELETPKLSYLSTRLGAEAEAQEAVDSIRAEAAKSHHTMETISKCIRYIDYPAIEKMTPAILDLTKSTVNLGTKIACAHFICLISTRLGKEMTPLAGKYLGASFNNLKDKNITVRKHYASAIGHLVGIAKEQSIKNLLAKLDNFYMENPLNRGVPLTIHSINKRHHDLLKDYMENVLPLIFFAMHEEINEENKNNVELWKELWTDISPGDAGIRMNLKVIILKLEESLNDASWLRKIQSANAIKTLATRLGSNLEDTERLHLINLLLNIIPGRTFNGKERLLEALSSLCKHLNKNDEKICERIIDIAMKECKKQEPQYRTHALKSIGNILEDLEIDKFEEVYNMIWYILDKKDLQSVTGDKNDTNDGNGNNDDEIMSNLDNIDERNRRAQILNKLKETVCETLGKSWPKNSFDTQQKYQMQFVEQCVKCLKDNTRQVQVSLLVALGKFLDRLQIFDEQININKEKKVKLDGNRDLTIDKICDEVLSSILYASSLPHTGLKKESLNIILILIKRLNGKENIKHLMKIKNAFDENLKIFEKDSSPEIRCRIKDIEDKLNIL